VVIGNTRERTNSHWGEPAPVIKGREEKKSTGNHIWDPQERKKEKGGENGYQVGQHTISKLKAKRKKKTEPAKGTKGKIHRQGDRPTTTKN